MRITNRAVTEKYLRSVNNIAAELDRRANQVYTGKRYTKASQEAPAAVKAFQIRKDIARVQGYQSSLNHAKGMLNNAESSIMKVQELLHDAREKIVQGLNGSNSSEEREIIATHLGNLQQQMLQLLNSNAADIYYFGGNSVRQEPFSVDPEDGSLRYNCKDGDDFRKIKLSEISSDPNDGKKYELYQQLMQEGLFVDIGLGIRSENDYVDSNSVFTYTLPGIDITGVGTTISDVTGQEVSMNIYDLLGKIADSFRSDYSYEKTDELFGFLYGWEKDQLPLQIRTSSPKLPNGSNNPEYDPANPNYNPKLDDDSLGQKPVGLDAFDQTEYNRIMNLYENISAESKPGAARSVQFAITNVGTKMQFLNFVSDSLDTRMLDNLEQQQDAEFIDPAEAIIYHESQKVAYQAALAMGAKIMPMSIFDYMR
jgi:flagellar hook-associated protein 3 FlgL